MALANVQLTNTFDEWRTRTNELIVQGESVIIGTAAAFTQANVANTRAIAAFTKANTTTFTSNLAIVVAESTNAALRITQTGTAAALLVEDSSSTDSTPFVIDASGNVGIGLTSPTSPLHVIGAANITASLMLAGTDMITRLNNVGQGANAFTTNYSASVGLGANNYAVSASLGANAYAQAVGTAGNNYAALVGTAANGIAIAAFAQANSARTVTADVGDAVRYVMFSNGTSGVASSLNVATAFTFNPYSGTVGATNFNSTSDINLKYDIEKIENALDIISSIDGIKFKWKSNDQKSIGVIAQNVEKFLPELVNEVDGLKSVNYDGIIGVLIESVKSLKEEIERLKEKQK